MAVRAKVEPVVKTTRLSHGTLECADLVATRRFYEEFLGLECVYHQPEGGMMIRLGGSWCIFVVKIGKKDSEMPILNHFGVDVATKEEVDQAHQACHEYKEKYGIKKILQPKDQHGAYSFYFQDLDGNWWEIEHVAEDHDDRMFARGDITTH